MLPTPYVVGVKRYLPGAVDTHGNPLDAWSDPVDLPVSAIAPGAMVEAGQPNRDVSEIAYTILAPPHPNMPAERDLVVLFGVEFPVSGKPKDWTMGPWTFAPGWSFELQRVEG